MMNDSDYLAEQFEARREHLEAVAYRMLGSRVEAEDALQHAWLRIDRAGTAGVENIGGWFTTVVSRVCLDALRSRKAKREEPLEVTHTESAIEPAAGPEDEAMLADSIGAALMIVLDTLGPAERVAFVMHDLFDIPFDQIAQVLGKSADATRQLASRARRRVRGISANEGARAREDIVRAFLDAAREGNFEELLRLLDPNAILRADATVVSFGAEPEANGAHAVAKTFAGRAQAAQFAMLDGEPGLVWRSGGQTRVAFTFTFEGNRITAINFLGDVQRLAQMRIEPQ